MITCLLFDIDGTLFATNEANVASYADTFKELGLKFEKAKYRQLFGLRFPEIMQRLAPTADSHTRARIKSTKAKYYQQHLDLIKPNTGLIDLATSTAHTYRTGLVTTASKANIDNLLKHFEVDPNVFEFIITGEDVNHGKPDPECYHLAIKRLGVRPDECLVFEDSEPGVQAATAAGAQVVQVRL